MKSMFWREDENDSNTHSDSLHGNRGGAYFNAGSLGKSSWTPSTNEISMAFALAEHHCRYKLSDQRRASLTTSNEVEVVSDDGSLTIIVPPKFDSELPVRVDESFTIAGLPYSLYSRGIKTFLQPYSGRMLRMLAILHRPIEPNSGKAKPFTVYFNTDTGRVGTMRSIFPITLYSPGPPYSFHPKQQHKGSPTTKSALSPQAAPSAAPSER